MLYLDTSALLKLFVRGGGSEAVHFHVVSQDLPLAIWEIQEAELVNALRLRVVRRGLLRFGQAVWRIRPRASSVGDAAVHDPNAALLAVLEPFVRAQKHDPARSMPRSGPACLWAGYPPQAFSARNHGKISGFNVSKGRNQTILKFNSGTRVIRKVFGIAESSVRSQIAALMNVTPDPPRREAPWMAGLRAARANLVPALLVQGIMLAVVLGYYFHPPTNAWLNHLAELKMKWGYGYSALAAAIAGGVIPEIMRVAFFQKGRIIRANFSNLLFTIPFWSGTGMVVDLFYRSQAVWFGDEATVGVVITKVLVDQFVFNPLFAGPSGAWCYDWKHSGYSFKNIRRFLTPRYYRDVIVPILFATWGVWIPLVAIIYSLPSVLQIPLFALALAMWVMLYTWISEHRSAS